jgi:hypothetical protein
MGYSHYFNNIEASPSDWESFIRDVRKVVSLSKVPLEAEVLSDQLLINGAEEENQHEDLFITQKSKGHQFCKTARKPYDTVVCAVLHLYEYHIGKDVHISSDGDLEDDGWVLAYQMILEHFGVEHLTGCYYRRRSEARSNMGDPNYRLPEKEQNIDEYNATWHKTIADSEQEVLLKMPDLGDNDSWVGPDEDKPTKEQILTQMKLHDEVELDGNHITRVPSGWLYQRLSWNVPVFVPFDNFVRIG